MCSMDGLSKINKSNADRTFNKMFGCCSTHVCVISWKSLDHKGVIKTTVNNLGNDHLFITKRFNRHSFVFVTLRSNNAV